MRSFAVSILGLGLVMGAPAFAQAPVPVTVDNFVRAETDRYFTNSVNGGGFGAWHHIRDLIPIDHQPVIRGNRDTLYSSRVFDLDAGPVTITLPDAGQRYMSLQIITEDQYTWTEYGLDERTIDKAKVGTRYVLAGVRTLVDPNDAEDLKRVHALQDAIKVSQPGGPGKFEIRTGTRPVRRRFGTRFWFLRQPLLIRAAPSAGRVTSIRFSI